MNRRSFYEEVRRTMFAGQLRQSQVDGIEMLLDEFERRSGYDQRWLAYILATTFHETARTMQPIREFGRGRGRPYGRPDPATGHAYFGRGFVQLTWKANYKKMGDKLGVNLVNNPDLALDPETATKIIFVGMEAGDFTGKKLGNYFTSTASDWYEARRIINLLDKASTIAGYGRQFYAAVLGAMRPALANLTPDPMPDPEGGDVVIAGAERAAASAVEEEAAAIIAEYLAARGE